MGKVFSSSRTTPGPSFAVVLYSNTQQEQKPQSASVEQACPTSLWHNQQVPGQSVQAPNKKKKKIRP
jgi:hypothetical protein